MKTWLIAAPITSTNQEERVAESLIQQLPAEHLLNTSHWVGHQGHRRRVQGDPLIHVSIAL